MTYSNAQFRQDFPEFSDATKYPDSQLTFWSGVGIKLLDPCRWGDVYDQGVELYTAHQLVLAAQSEAAAAAGQAPGQVRGAVTSKAVGQASIGYDAGGASIEEGAGYYNLTTYGRQFIHLARMFGAGAVQL